MEEQLADVEMFYGRRWCDPLTLEEVELRYGVHESDQLLQHLVHVLRRRMIDPQVLAVDLQGAGNVLLRRRLLPHEQA